MSFALPFTLKRLIAQFLMPVPLVIEVFVLGWALARFTRFKRTGSACKVVAGCLFVVFAYGWGGGYLFRIERHYPPFDPSAEEAERLRGATVVVLGQGLVPASDLPLRSRMPPTFPLRLFEGIRVCKAIPDSRLLVSLAGEATLADKEAYLAQYAAAMGFACTNMALLTAANDTSDEARLTRAKVAAGHPLILVTSAAHLPRAMHLFSKSGLTPVPAPCDYQYICEHRPWKWTALPLPSGGGIIHAEAAAYEWLGSLYERLRD